MSACKKQCPKQTIKKCGLPRGVVTAEKNLLNVSYITEGAVSSEPDFSATYEIIIFNNTCNKIKNLSVVDSFLGLKGQTFDPTGQFGGELRPFFTNVGIISNHPTIVPLGFDDIITNNDELLNVAQSYIAPCSFVRIILRITGRGFLIPQSPTTGTPIPTTDSKWTAYLQNTAVISGDVCLDECGTSVKMYPVYVKSGVVQTAQNIAFISVP